MLVKVAKYLVAPHALNSGFGLVAMFALTGVVASLVLVQQDVNISPAEML